MKTNIIRNFQKVLKLLVVTNMFGSHLSKINQDQFLETVERRQKTRGNLDTILWQKDLRLTIHRYVSGSPWQPRFIATSGGIPKVFGQQVPFLINRDKGAIRLALSLIQISRLISGWKVPDLSTVTEVSTMDESVFTEFKLALPRLMAAQRKNIQSTPWTGPHLTSKVGPMGTALYTCINELLILPRWLLEAIWNMGGPELQEYMIGLLRLSTVSNMMGKVREGRKGLLRKLSIVKDQEGKSRVIAIGDYWSQTALRQLHKAELAIQRSLETDQTFGQNIAPFGPEDQPYYSFDLTAATDRIPVQLYEEMMVVWRGTKAAKAWRDIMVRLPFDYLGRAISYGCGQPMGQYSSWTSLALVHHLIVQFAAKKVGITNFTDYRILGDDIVIRSTLVAESYLAVMTSLGVNISKDKTLVSKDTFEFAKRLFHLNEEVTGFPLAAQFPDHITWLNTYSAQGVSLRRGYPATLVKSRPFVEQLCKVLLGSYGSVSRAHRWGRAILSQQIIHTPTPDYRLQGEQFDIRVTCNNELQFRHELGSKITTDLLETTGAKAQSELLRVDTLLMKGGVLPQSLADHGGQTTTTLSGYSIDHPLYTSLQRRADDMMMEVIEFTSQLDQPFTGVDKVKETIQWIEAREFRMFNPNTLEAPTRRSERGTNMSSTLLLRAQLRKRNGK